MTAKLEGSLLTTVGFSPLSAGPIRSAPISHQQNITGPPQHSIYVSPEGQQQQVVRRAEAVAAVQRNRQLRWGQDDPNEALTPSTIDDRRNKRGSDATPTALRGHEKIREVTPSAHRPVGDWHPVEDLQIDHANRVALSGYPPPAAGVLSEEPVAEARDEVARDRLFPPRRAQSCEFLNVVCVRGAHLHRLQV